MDTINNTSNWFNWIEYDLDPIMLLNPWNLFDPIQMIHHLIDFDIRVMRMVFTLILAIGGAIVYNNNFTDPFFEGYERHGMLGLFGFSLGFYNYGFSFLWTTVTIIVVFAILYNRGGTKFSIVLTWIVSVGHLWYGYYSNHRIEEYIYDWTIPHSVLSLKLIAVSFDLYDGVQSRRKSKKMSIQNADAIDRCPTLFQLFSHCYFPGSFLVGPQFSIKRTIDFAEDGLEQNLLGRVQRPAMKKILIGFAYGITHELASKFFPPSDLLTVSFSDQSLVMRLLIFTITMKIQFLKYFFFFLVCEGICILYGINFNPDLESEDKIDYKMCANCDPLRFDITGGSFLESFDKGHNVSTNRWIAKYIFYRLPSKSLLERNCIRSLIASFFIASWHGFHSGYYNTFFLISVIYSTEWDFIQTFGSRIMSCNRYIRLLKFLLLRIYSTFLLPYIFCSMLYLTSDKYLKVYSDIYFCGHLLFMIYWLFRLIREVFLIIVWMKMNCLIIKKSLVIGRESYCLFAPKCHLQDWNFPLTSIGNHLCHIKTPFREGFQGPL